MEEQKFSHMDANGNAIMVDVGKKAVTQRIAQAGGLIFMKKETLAMICGGHAKKGDVLAAARIAGIMAAKRTWELIPLCHPLQIERCTLDFVVRDTQAAIEAVCTVKVSGKTGVEMEALTGASVALLTIYDMCKAVDRGMTIKDLCLYEKEGGKSGHYLKEKEE